MTQRTAALGPGAARRAEIATLLRWQWGGQWRQQPGRALIAVIAIAIGVSLGLAIHLVNRSALDEFGRAMSIVNGEAQAQILPTGESFDEALYAKVGGEAGRNAGISAASPIIDIRVQAGPADRTDPRNQTLRLIGLDLYRAARVSPALLPQVSAGADNSGGSGSPLFGDDTIFLSQAAQQAFDVKPGQRLTVHAGTRDVELRVAGDVGGNASGSGAGSGSAPVSGSEPGSGSGSVSGSGSPAASSASAGASQIIGVMDIGAMQWRLNWLGRLNRIDLTLKPGADLAHIEQALSSDLGRAARLQRPEASAQRMSNLSRAYRVNLSVLSLVALFTGAFIVYSTLALAITRQRASLAMLAVLGASKGLLRATVLGQGLLLGLIGALLGGLLGIGLAWLLLANVGGDLGGGYFSGSRPALSLDPFGIALYVAAGIAAGLIGSWWPMVSLGSVPAVRMLRGAEPLTATRRWRSLVWPLFWLACGAVLLALPAVEELPLAAYAAIAAWLFAGIATVPAIVATMSQLIGRWSAAWRWPPVFLAVQRLSVARYAAAGALSGVVASFALASAMAIMVTSFAGSVEQWLDRVLPADLYTRSASTGSTGALSAAAGIDSQTVIERLQKIPGVAQVELLRATEITLSPTRPAVTVLARKIDVARPQDRLPLASRVVDAPDGTTPIYVSEAMVDLYGMSVGKTIDLPLGDGHTRYFVRAVWRDYARQFGSIVIDDRDYQSLTGDLSYSDIAVWTRNGQDPSTILTDIHRQLPELDNLPWRSAGDIRALSLTIFDRSFVVTYLLEAIAMGVGLFGVAATFAGEAFSRSREFGMLRHLGITRRQVSGQLATEAFLLVAFGVIWGAIVGLAIAWVLIRRVNPQSFHWTMDVSIPYGTLGLSALALIVLGVLTAAVASRQASGQSPVQAVRSDW